ncbi:MAG TPA: glycyl-radical enzyme activating protein [Clostridiales bacterium]|nr:glycyl-radical enzyme activating protein [Clostridiales bacterium]
MDSRDLDKVGRIFNIQRFSVHDGPGIRTIVFLKGCAFRCRWCCNPESQSFEIQTMNVDGKVKTEGQDITVKEVMDVVLKDRPYYNRSGGGLTLSGGESLLQPEFAVALLRTAKNSGINTAMESTGFASFDVIERFLPHLDLYLMDIKHLNSRKHEEFIGRPNELVLENAKKIAKYAKKLIIRVPVIPTFNDTKEEILDISKFAASLENVNEIHLLPYHRLGADKYKWLGREYLMGDVLPPNADKMNELKAIAESTGLKCQIGG